ncbi:unnamed protein product, partial [Hymenolepis diminuta]
MGANPGLHIKLLLLEAKALIRTLQNYLLHYSGICLKSSGIKIHQFYRSTDFEGKPLISAITAKNLKQAKTALKNYSTLCQIDGHGNTALHHAAENGFMEAVKLLIKYKCGLNAINNMGFTPLLVALQNYHTEVARELLNAG